jgi:phosphinothricin acetyltransferase
MSTAQLLVRPATNDDVPALTDLYNHYVLTSPATFDIEPVNLEARRDWASHYATSGPHRLLVAVQDDQVVGYACSSRFREKLAYRTSVEMSVYVHHETHGQGIGSRLYERLFEQLAGEPIHRAYAGVTLPNPGLLALHRRFGFRDIGVYDEVGHKFGQFWSVHWFEKVMND